MKRSDLLNNSDVDGLTHLSPLRHAALEHFVQTAILAPSAYNTQPWRFEIRPSEIDLLADYDRSRPYADPDGRELVMSCGAALLNLRLAIREAGYQYELYPFPDHSRPDLLARVVVRGTMAVTPSEHSLYLAIPKRRTQREPFADKLVPKPLLRRLEEAATSETTHFQPILDSDRQLAIAQLVARAERKQWEDPRFCREWTRWFRGNQPQAGDGLPGYSLGLGSTLAPWTPLLVRALSPQTTLLQKLRANTLRAPLLAVIETGGDSPAHWLNAGQALARVLLTARAEGLNASFLNQPIQVAECRRELRALLGGSRYPQALMRMGFAPDPKPTPRRPWRDVVGSQPESAGTEPSALPSDASAFSRMLPAAALPIIRLRKETSL